MVYRCFGKKFHLNYETLYQYYQLRKLTLYPSSQSPDPTEPP